MTTILIHIIYLIIILYLLYLVYVYRGRAGDVERENKMLKKENEAMKERFLKARWNNENY